MVPGAIAAVAAMRSREDGPEYHEAGERERPVPEVPAETAQRAFRSSRQVQDEIAGDGECGRRKQRQEIDHETPVRSAIDRWILLPPLCGTNGRPSRPALRRPRTSPRAAAALRRSPAHSRRRGW